MQKKLMKVDEHSDGSSSWRIACDCYSPDHDAKLWFDTEDDWPVVQLHLSMHHGFYPRYLNSFSAWWEDKVRRVSHASRVLWSGWAELEGEVILDEEGIKAMQLALAEGMKHAKSVKSKHEAERIARLNAKAISGKNGKAIKVGS